MAAVLSVCLMTLTRFSLFPLIRPTQTPPPPYEKMDFLAGGQPAYGWTITNDESARLSALLGRNFNETGMGGTYVNTPPRPCTQCGKWTEFIDWYVSLSSSEPLIQVEDANSVDIQGVHCAAAKRARQSVPICSAEE